MKQITRGIIFHRLLRDFLVDAEHLEDLRVKEMWHRRIR